MDTMLTAALLRSKANELDQKGHTSRANMLRQVASALHATEPVVIAWHLLCQGHSPWKYEYDC